jgi:hypothetical protein
LVEGLEKSPMSGASQGGGDYQFRGVSQDEGRKQ